jgi:hypothetical protein
MAMTRLYRKRPRKPSCSLCRRGYGETVVLHFSMVRQEWRDGARTTMRGAGAIDLCEPCWVRVTTAARIRRRSTRAPSEAIA